MLMLGASAGLKESQTLRGQLMAGRASRGERRFRRGAVYLSHPLLVIPHSGAGKTFIQQDSRRSHRILVGIEGGKVADGVSAIGPVKPDFVILQARPHPLRKTHATAQIGGAALCYVKLPAFISYFRRPCAIAGRRPVF